MKSLAVICFACALISCGGGSTSSTPASTQTTGPDSTNSSGSQTTGPDDTNTTGSQTTDPAVDAQGRYDLGRYGVPATGGAFTWNTYREENNTLTAQDVVNIDITDRQVGPWVRDVRLPVANVVLDYRIRDQEIDIVLEHNLLPLDMELTVKRFASVGESLLVPPAPYDAVLTLESHLDTFTTTLSGNPERTDNDVIFIDGFLDFPGLVTETQFRFAMDLGTIGAVDRDCVDEGILLDTVDDTRPDSQCDRIYTDYTVLDSSIAR